jgi:ankyrin repeat protein
MSRQVTPQTTLENLKREAKRWLKALRDNVADARSRLDRAFPSAPDVPTLRDVQHALALEHGLPGWSALKTRVGDTAQSAAARARSVDWFLENACPDHHVRGGPAHVRARHTAMRLLEHDPGLATDTFYTSVVCGERAEVERALSEQPGIAVAKSSAPSQARSNAGHMGDLNRDLGPKGWEPLLCLCFTRLPLESVDDNAVAIARALLDGGADPNVYFMAGSSRYTPMVGAIGEGEEERPPHQQRGALVRLLLEFGADPYDNQVLYNIHFRADVRWFFEMIYEHSVKIGRKADWDDPNWSMLGMGGYGPGAHYWLGVAIGKNDLELAEWFLTHGASPNVAESTHPKFRPRSLHELALRHGFTEMADLLVRYGAIPSDYVPDAHARFVEACLRLDRTAVERGLAEHPEWRSSPGAIFEATRRNRADVVALLLDLGVSPDVAKSTNERPLHMAAYHDSIDAAKVLIDRGAEVDAVASEWDNTPLGAAVYAQHARVIELLAKHSRDIWELAFSGQLERLRVLFAESPSLAKMEAQGHTPLMWLPTNDEQLAIEIARLFLERGANPAVRTRDGVTAAGRAERLGMFDLAELLRNGLGTS